MQQPLTKKRKYIASTNRLGKLEANHDRRIAFRKEILALQQKGAKRTRDRCFDDNLLPRSRLLHHKNSTGKFCRHLETRSEGRQDTHNDATKGG